MRTHPQGTTVLVLGILSLVICSLLGPVAWSMGQKAIREMDADPSATYTNRGSVNAGRICGIISTCLMIVGIVVIVVIAAAGGT
jgi:phosphotransferase system  glucose/maltose/N-acetylglucosamine-specific IIC component